MKKITILVMVLCLMVGIGIMAKPAGATMLKYGENELFFFNYELVFDSDGNQIEFTPGGTPPVLNEGDHFVGIVNIQNIDQSGTSHWLQSTTDQLSGIFAQRVEHIYDVAGGADPDPYAPANSKNHIVLGTPTISTFTLLDGSTTISTGFTGDEMFAFYNETGAGTQMFESNGTIDQDWAIAKAGSKWLTLGYNNGSDNTYETGDDTGYAYTHSSLGTFVENFTGETWAAINVIYNNTGWGDFPGINDPAETEVDGISGYLPPGFLTDLYLSGELEPNPGFLAETSPWVFRSNDPAHINVVPEPATMLLLGSGLIGLAGFARRKVKNLS